MENILKKVAILVAFLLALVTLGGSYYLLQGASGDEILVPAITHHKTPTTPKPIVVRPVAPAPEPVVSVQEWIPVSTLQIPPTMRAVISNRQPGLVGFSYENITDTVNNKILTPADPKYPGPITFKLTAFSHSTIMTSIVGEADVSTLQISKAGHFLIDKDKVYAYGCGGLLCVFAGISGADPATFHTINEKDFMKAFVKDAQHVYMCVNGDCSAIQNVDPATFDQKSIDDNAYVSPEIHSTN